MKISRSEMRQLVRDIRDGKAPKVPEGKFDQLYYCPEVFDGFLIRLLPSGRGTWYVEHKTHGRGQRVKIGDVRVFDFDDAVKHAKDTWAKIQLKRLDPQAAKAEARNSTKNTFESVAELFLVAKEHEGLRGTSMMNYRLYLTKNDYFGPWHKLPVDEIDHTMINLRLKEIAEGSARTAKKFRRARLTTAGRCASLLNTFFRWAVKEGLHPGPSPMQRANKMKKEKKRERVLNEAEIRVIWQECLAWEAEALAGGKPQGHGRAIPDRPRALRLLMLTSLRRDEVADMEWKELDLDKGTFFLPAERSKNEIPLFLPLTDTAIEILRSVARRPGHEHLFGTLPGQGLSMNNTHLMINERLGAKLPANSPLRKSLGVDLRTPGGAQSSTWTIHDVRRTVATGMASIGIQQHVIDRVQNHKVLGDVPERYNRWDYCPEKRDALIRWEDHLLSLVVEGRAKKFAAPQWGRREAS